MTKKNATSTDAPTVVSTILSAHHARKKSVVIVTGNTADVFYDNESSKYASLEKASYEALRETFHVVRIDSSTGIEFHNQKDQDELIQSIGKGTSSSIKFDITSKEGIIEVLSKIGKAGRQKKSEDQGEDESFDYLAQMAGTRHSPLAAIELLRIISKDLIEAKKNNAAVKPLCVVMQMSEFFFPQGTPSQLSEIDRKRLVSFLSWINEPEFEESDNLIVLVADSASMLNSRIVERSSSETIEIPLPEKKLRGDYVKHYFSTHGEVQLEMGLENFLEDTAGLTLTGIRDLLGEAKETKVELTSAKILEHVNKLFKRMLGDVITIVYPEHGPDAIIGYANNKKVTAEVFENANDPETASSMMLFSGPNGAGKTFHAEAFARDSKRVVIRLSGVRDMWFGNTDRAFEKLRMIVSIYGKVLIIMDEAHVHLGNTQKEGGHDTEQRLAGSIISMMSDPKLRGKVLWCLMTSRPDLLSSDVLSRASEQIPILDLEGEERLLFIKQLLGREGINLDEESIKNINQRTANYSNRDFFEFKAKVLAKRKKDPNITPLKVLDIWSAPADSIETQRFMQTLIAVLHCSYPQLRPKKFTDLNKVRNVSDKMKNGLPVDLNCFEIENISQSTPAS